MGLQAASLISRSAVIADHLIATILGSLLGIPIGIGLAAVTPVPWPISAAGIIVLVNVVYFIAFESRTGTTPAKEQMDLTVLHKDSLEPIETREAVIRNVFRIIDFSTFYLTGIGLAFASSHSQRLGDQAAQTVVVTKQDGETDKLTPEEPELQTRFIGWLLAIVGLLPFIGIGLTII